MVDFIYVHDYFYFNEIEENESIVHEMLGIEM